MQAADYVASFLHGQGVRHVFEVSGGMITRLIDALHRDGRIRLVSVHHEQAAAFAAEGTARITGVPGVAMATSGPGALNLLTGVASCFFDSTPAVFITGQVNRAERRGERPIRQLGFQETDIVSVAEPVTKRAWRVEEASELPEMLEAAFRTARDGRPGPVLLDVPMDVQGSELSEPRPGEAADAPLSSAPPVEPLLDELACARRPLILAGGGVRGAGAADELRRLAHATGTPVVTSLLGVDVLPSDDPLRVGMIGTYGNRWANTAVGRSDLLLVLGSRLDIRQTGADVDAFKAGRAIHHVDCDRGEINNRVTGCVSIEAHLKPFLAAAAQAAESRAPASTDAWRREIEQLRQTWPDTAELEGIPGINPNLLMRRLQGPAAAYVTDVGQHQMWAAQSLPLTAGQRFVTSGGLGAMGSGLPLAVGVALSASGGPTVLVAGDGGFQLNIQELETVARNALPIKIVVLNNRCHGMVRQFQETYFEQRYPSTWWGYSAPDFRQVAEAYGIAAATVAQPGELDAGLAGLWGDPTAPALLEVAIDPLANVYPKIAFGRPLTEMEPFAAPVALQRT